MTYQTRELNVIAYDYLAQLRGAPHIELSGGGMNQQMTNKDLLAWMDDFLVRLMLRVSVEHDITHQDGTLTAAAK